MTQHTVNGYLVVSAVNDIPYRGVDRDPWNTIDRDYYEGSLPDEIRRSYEAMRAGDARGFWWPVARSRNDAARLLAFTRRREPDAELLAVHSPYLEAAVGIKGWTELGATFLGIDVVSVGEWSLLRSLQGSPVDSSEETVARTNDSGLLRDAVDAESIEKWYRRAVEEGHVEEIADSDSGIVVEPVEVFLVALEE